MPKYTFEYEKFSVCGDCPCWCPRTMGDGVPSDDGTCWLNIEERDRFEDRPKDCPLKESEE